MTVDDYLEILETIDASGRSVTDWEANFIDNLLSSNPDTLTPRQMTIISEMELKYL